MRVEACGIRGFSKIKIIVILLIVKEFMFTVCSRALRNQQLCKLLYLNDKFGESDQLRCASLIFINFSSFRLTAFSHYWTPPRLPWNDLKSISFSWKPCLNWISNNVQTFWLLHDQKMQGTSLLPKEHVFLCNRYFEDYYGLQVLISNHLYNRYRLRQKSSGFLKYRWNTFHVPVHFVALWLRYHVC